MDRGSYYRFVHNKYQASERFMVNISDLRNTGINHTYTAPSVMITENVRCRYEKKDLFYRYLRLSLVSIINCILNLLKTVPSAAVTCFTFFVVCLLVPSTEVTHSCTFYIINFGF
jgi:hypothetical protein